MTNLIVMLIISGVSAWLCTAWVCRHAEKWRLVQAPNHRSSHVRPTPHGGGVGIVLSGVGSGVLLAWENGTIFWSVVSLSLLVAAVGFYDDMRNLSAKVRFVGQLLVCLVLLLTLDSMPILELPAGFDLYGLPLFFMLWWAGVWWVNLFNFMDGIDGIAGGQGFFMLLSGSLLGVLVSPALVDQPVWWWMLALAGATLGFLLHNWPPARIFMGDVGSTYLAFMILSLALLSVRDGWMTYTAWMILGAGFVADATVTLLRRMLAGERWFDAHRSHAYQILSRRWRSHRDVALLFMAVNAMWLAPLAWLSFLWPTLAWFFVFVAYCPLVGGAILVGAGGEDKSYT